MLRTKAAAWKTAVVRAGVLVFALTGVVAPAEQAFAHGDLHGQIEQVTANMAEELKRPAGAPGSEEAHERHHERAKFCLERAELYRLHGDWRKAAVDYDCAAAHEPNLGAVALARAHMLFESGAPARARRVLDGFLATNVDHPEALLLQAQVLVKLGEGARAVRFLDRALARHPQPEPDHYQARADILARLGRSHLPRAIAGLDAGIARLGPIVALDERAMTFELQLGRTDAALARIERQAKLSGRPDLWLARRADVLERSGNRSGARVAHQDALRALKALPPHLQARPATRKLEQQLTTALARN
jgi:tetratricopeptide (TPR) repeat protein